MHVFIKRFYGFDPISWPCVSFSLLGSLESLLETSSPGDVMAFVGTKGEQTPEHFRGRLLGLAEFGRKRVPTREMLPPATFAAAEKGPNGDVKWPYAVRMTRAWRFTDAPLPDLVEVLGRQLPMSAIKNAVFLSQGQVDLILKLPREEVEVRLTPDGLVERDVIATAVGSGGTMGPPPSSHTALVTKNALQSASTYAFRFGTKHVWKVGWAHDLKQRLDELNVHVPHEVLDGQMWHGKGGFLQKWASAAQAYDMEQRVLASFPGEVKYGERVHCKREQLDAAWQAAWKN